MSKRTIGEKLYRAMLTFIAFGFIGMMVLGGVAFVILFYQYIEGVPGEYESREVLTPEVPAGERLKVHAVVVWDRDCTSSINREIIDADGKAWPFGEIRRLNRKGRQDLLIEQRVPYRAAPGPAIWRVTQEFYCNFYQLNIQPFRYDHPDLHFRITAPIKQEGSYFDGRLTNPGLTRKTGWSRFIQGQD